MGPNLFNLATNTTKLYYVALYCCLYLVLLKGGGGGFRPITSEKKDFELGVGGEGQDTSRNFEGSFGSIRAILPM